MESLGIFRTIWSILRPLEIFYGRLVYFWSFGIFPRFGILYQEKSGNPATYATHDETDQRQLC
jgi:hypothetical protein